MIADTDAWQASVAQFEDEVRALDGPLGDLFCGIAAVYSQFLAHAELDAVTGAEQMRMNCVINLAIEAHARLVGER